MIKKKLKSIMLVDDDRNDNFFHEREILKVNPDILVITRTSGIDALEYLKTATEKPELVFLDINMPIWDGWAFLLEYSRLEKDYLKDVMIMVLTSSRNPADELRAKSWDFVSGFIIKPLTKEILRDIIKKYFPESLN
jgi:PleD family two-component response regulator